VITEFLLSLVFGLVWGMLGVLPEYTFLPAAARSAIEGLEQYFGYANVLFPVDTLFTIAAIIFGIEGALLTFKLGNWLFDKIRGAG